MTKGKKLSLRKTTKTANAKSHSFFTQLSLKPQCKNTFQRAASQHQFNDKTSFSEHTLPSIAQNGEIRNWWFLSLKQLLKVYTRQHCLDDAFALRVSLGRIAVV